MLRSIVSVVKRLAGTPVRVDIFQDGNRSVVRSRGLRAAGHPEVEISGCPSNLQEVASSLVMQIALNGKETPESLANGKTIGGRFAHIDQPLLESFGLLRVEENSSVLRIVDVGDSDGVFPRRLIATHLCATAGVSRRDSLRLLLVSIEVWPKEKVASTAGLADYELNPNNFWSWIDLGTVLSKTGKIDEAVLHWKTGVCMWPRGGKLYAKRMVERSSSSKSMGASSQAVNDFWKSVTSDTIRNWSSALAVELPESALMD